MDKVRTVNSKETAVLLLKCDALMRLIALLATFVIWYSIALAALIAYLFQPGPLQQVIQALLTAGFAPLAAVALTWRFVELALVHWWNAFVRERVEAS
ncbi:MAG: hypothetical protein ING37_11675 [Rhodocyclaceae bacterium]|jgi:hypothetical protein|nr:hypothetical protein [Rhodocyclaceae bacterium]